MINLCIFYFYEYIDGNVKELKKTKINLFELKLEIKLTVF